MFITAYFLYRNLQNNVTTIQTYILLCYASYVSKIQPTFTTSIFQTCQWAVQTDNTFPCTNMRETYWDVNMFENYLLGCYAGYTSSVYRRFGKIYRNHLQVQAVLHLADGTNKLSLNVAK